MQDIPSSMTTESLHFTHLPSGVFYDHTTSVIGNGVALNIPVLFKEIAGDRKSEACQAEDLSF